jgi:hypothetical protein
MLVECLFTAQEGSSSTPQTQQNCVIFVWVLTARTTTLQCTTQSLFIQEMYEAHFLSTATLSMSSPPRSCLAKAPCDQERPCFAMLSQRSDQLSVLEPIRRSNIKHVKFSFSTTSCTGSQPDLLPKRTPLARRGAFLDLSALRTASCCKSDESNQSVH